jgi:eukaryotic-like serine/threonine-protein kinase
MSLLPKRSRWHLRLAVLVAGGTVVGLLVTAWVPKAWVGVLGGSITAAVTAVALGVQAEWQRRSELVRRLPGALEASSASGRFPLVQDLSDPIAVGVHPAAAVEVGGLIDRIPPYITRDIEPELHAVLQRGGFVLLVGESAAGKTRAAFEATRLLLGCCRFAAPSSREALPALLEVLGETGDYVVWLDDLERFLGYGGLTTSVLHRLLSPPVRTVVVATMRSQEYDRYRDRIEVELLGADRDVWREGRAVLRQAQVVHLDRRWTPEEQSRVRAHTSDHRLAQALNLAHRFGIAETLAAGPELAEAWRHGWTPGHHPRGAALVAAAVGARKVGYHRALPLEVLERMHTAYLAERGGPELHPEPIAEAVLWSTTPTFPNGANSLLIGSAEQGFMAFDYLIDLPLVNRMPDQSWSVLVDVATGSEAYLLAEHALQTGRHDQAVVAYRRAVEAGYAPAEAALADIGLPFKPLSESLERARRHLDVTRREFGPDHENTILAEQSVIGITINNERYSDALAMAEQVTARREAVLGPEHRLVLAAKFSIAYCTFKLGATDEGLVMLDNAAEETVRALGPLDTAAMHRRITTASLMAEVGQTDMARERLIKIQEECVSFPQGHFISTALKQAVQQLESSK